ncbi:MAG: InlB B-repeat-containing protein, partial [Methanomassiliicoccaceae archaeon]|nr:InlB B-repeat-containing protein [Methanomassiliicoccaceae archaeon]
IIGDTMLYAGWVEDGAWWDVTFESNGGSAVDAERVPGGLQAVEPAEPVREFYTFGGWYSDPGLTTAFAFTTPITSDTVLYAEWNEDGQWWTVTYNSNGGSAVASQRVPDGQLVTEPAAPSKAFYAFGDWYSDAALTTAFVFTTPITSDITLYAEWNEDGTWWTVTYESNEGSPVDAQRIPDGQLAAEPAAPVKEFYAFDDWYSDPGLTTVFVFTTPITSDITLYAGWTEDGDWWDVTFDTDGGSLVDAQHIPDGQFASKPSPPEKAGYLFAGWHSDPGATVMFSFASPIISDTTLYAKWVAAAVVTWSVTFETDGGSAVVSQTVPDGEYAMEPAPPVWDFHTFEGWFSDIALTSLFDFAAPITSDITLYAKWEEVPPWWDVTFETNGGSPADVQRVPDGEKIFEPSTSREFYITEGWYLDPSFAGTAWDFLNDVVTEDITLYVKWDEDPMHAWFTITVSSEADRYFTHTFDGTEPPESPFVIPASGEHDIRAAFGMVFEVTAEEKVMWTYEDTRTIGATFSETVEKDMYLTASFELPGAGDNAIDESWTLLILFLILAAFLLLFLLWSRNRPVITGTVKRDGAGAAGVEIGYTVKGKNAETASDVRYVTADANGRYRITVPMGAEVAVISFAAGGNELSGRTASFLIDKKVTEADFDL